MIKKLFAISITIVILLSFVIIPGYAADPPSDKSVYFQDNAAVNCTVDASGSNTETLISGDVLKIRISGKSDPNFAIKLNDNVDTATYKILALKVKKTHNDAIAGEIYYNVKGQVAAPGNSLAINYAAGTDYQWVHIDLSTKSVAQVGFIRYDVYQESPTDNEYLTLAGIGFFKSVDDMNAFATSDTGKNLGTNEGDKNFPIHLGGSLAGPGIWLNTVSDATKPGFYWVKFNASLPIKKINIFQIYAKNGTGKWALYKYNGNFEKTMSGTPVATNTISQAKDNPYSITFATPVAAGQYVLYFEQDMAADTYFNIGTTESAFDAKKFQFGYNGTKFGSTQREMIAGSVEFVGYSATPFADIVADTTTNPQTGSVSLIGLAVIPLISVLIKKRRA